MVTHVLIPQQITTYSLWVKSCAFSISNGEISAICDRCDQMAFLNFQLVEASCLYIPKIYTVFTVLISLSALQKAPFRNLFFNQDKKSFKLCFVHQNSRLSHVHVDSCGLNTEVCFTQHGASPRTQVPDPSLLKEVTWENLQLCITFSMHLKKACKSSGQFYNQGDMPLKVDPRSWNEQGKGG